MKNQQPVDPNMDVDFFLEGARSRRSSSHASCPMLPCTVLHCNRPKSRDIAIRLLLNLPLDVFVIKLHLVDLVDSA